MKKEIFSILTKCVEKLKMTPRHTCILAILITTVIYVMSPALFGESYIKVSPDNRLLIQLPKRFQSCDIKFQNKIFIQSYIVNLLLSSPINVKTKKWHKFVNSEVGSLKITNIIPEQSRKRDIKGYGVEIKNKTVLPIEIIGIRIDGEKQDLKSFYGNNVTSRFASYVDRQYIRENISSFLLLYNDAVSNYILTAMCISLIPLSAYMLRLQTQLYIYSNKRFLRQLTQEVGLTDSLTKDDISRAADEYALQYLRKDSWLRFIQILGPSVGFMLTVSSLIAALHPIIEKTNDISGFMTGIHVAMISTLLGLIIRIVGTVSQRVNEKLLLRANRTFAELVGGTR